jgi:hypothetical protein
VDHVRAQRRRVGLAERLRSSRFDLATRFASDATPEDVVLAAAVDPDHGPHAVVVRHDRHARRPDDVQDRWAALAVQHLDPGALRRADRTQHRSAIRHGARDDLSHGRLRIRFDERRAAARDEALDVERLRDGHRISPLPQSSG